MKLHTVENQPGMLVFQCPACGNCHNVLVEGATRPGPRWGWNGSMDAPTFTPSIKVTSKHYPSGGAFPMDDEHARVIAGEQLKAIDHVCHSFVRDGRIEYCGDSTHKLAGQTVELPEW